MKDWNGIGQKEVNMAQLADSGQPYSNSYFIPGTIEGRPVQFLVDTGCTTNLISKHVFDRLPTRVNRICKGRSLMVFILMDQYCLSMRCWKYQGD